MRVGHNAPHRRRGVRGGVVELEQGLHIALLVAACHEQTSGGPGLTPSRLRAFRLVQHEHEEIDGHLGYLRARRPAIAGGSVHHVRLSHPVSPVSPVALPGRTEPCLYYTPYYSARYAKGPLPYWERALSCGN